MPELPEDLYIMICKYLWVESLLTIRLVCQGLHRATRSKSVWLSVITRGRANGLLPAVTFGRELAALTSEDLESFVRHAFHSERIWSQSQPVARVTRLDLPQRIVWIQWLFSRYVLLASTNEVQSRLLCYDFLEQKEVASACFSGRVDGGIAKADTKGNYISLSITDTCPFIYVFSLSSDVSEMSFVLQARHREFEHVLAFNGNLVLCTVYRGISIPHLLDWRTGLGHAILQEPDPHGTWRGALLRDNILIVAEAWGISVYDIQTLPGSISCSLTRRFHLLHPISSSSMAEIPHLSGAYSVLVHHDYYHHTQECVVTRILTYHLTLTSSRWTLHPFSEYSPEHKILSVGLGQTGFRAFILEHSPSGTQLLSARLATPGIHSSVPSLDFQRLMVQDHDELPALWAEACVDFVDAYGLIFVGNIFGEFAVIELDQSSGTIIAKFSGEPFSNGQTDASLNLELEASPPHNAEYLSERAAVLRRQLLALPDYSDDGWSPDVRPLLRDGWGEDRWELESHYSGEIIPLLYRSVDSTAVIYVGGLFVIFSIVVLDRYSVVLGGLDLNEIRQRLEDDWWEELELYVPPADLSRARRWEVSRKTWIAESKAGRNRWVEQKMRGGDPPQALLNGAELNWLEVRRAWPS